MERLLLEDTPMGYLLEFGYKRPCTVLLFRHFLKVFFESFNVTHRIHPVICSQNNTEGAKPKAPA